MSIFDKFTAWASGGETQYHLLEMCMSGDSLWITLLLLACVSVTLAYFSIAYLAFRAFLQNERKSIQSKLLRDFMAIFVLCSMCGYSFYVLKLWWPAYRLLTGLLFVLSFFSWRFAIMAHRHNFFGKTFKSLERSRLEDLKRITEELEKGSNVSTEGH